MNIDFTDFERNKMAVADGLFSKSYLVNLKNYISEQYQKNHLQKSTIGRGLENQIHSEKRGDFILWVDLQTPPFIEIAEFFENFKTQVNKHFFLSLKKIEAHITVYPPQTHYEKHVDQFKASSPFSLQRKVSFILYLNEDWKPEDGGALQIYNAEDDVVATVDPVFGRIVYFLSAEFPHEVLTIQNKERISLTAWFLG